MSEARVGLFVMLWTRRDITPPPEDVKVNVSSGQRGCRLENGKWRTAHPSLTFHVQSGRPETSMDRNSVSVSLAACWLFHWRSAAADGIAEWPSPVPEGKTNVVSPVMSR